MDFYISKITGDQIPYDPAEARELRSQGVPEILQDVPNVSEDAVVVENYTTLALDNDRVEAAIEASEESDLNSPTSNVESTSTTSLSSPAVSHAAASVIHRHEKSGGYVYDSEAAPVERPPISPVLQTHQATTSSDKNSDYEEAIDAYKGGQGASKRSARVVMKIEDIMTSPVLTLREDSPTESVWQFLKEHRFRHVPIVSDSNKLVGIISDRDFMNFQTRELPDSISSLITTNIITARPEADIRSAAKLMFEERIGALPVVDDSGDLVGIISRTDILRVLYARAPLELWI